MSDQSIFLGKLQLPAILPFLMSVVSDVHSRIRFNHANGADMDLGETARRVRRQGEWIK